MSDPLFKARQEHRELVARLREAFPDASGADLADTIEGESNLSDAIAGALRAAQEADAMADGVSAYIDKLTARKAVWEIRAGKLRDAAMRAAQDAGITKIPAADFTASIVTGKSKVQITGDVPDLFCRIKKEPDKKAISDAMTAGLKPTWASWSNATPHWQVRTK